MMSKILSRKYFGLYLTLALFVAALPVASSNAHAQEQTGQLTVTGTVKVNGHPAATGDIASSGDGVQTAKGSSAVVSLGKLGRVELLPSSSGNMSFDAGSFKVALESGRVRISSSSGSAARVSTKDGEAVADVSMATSFTVDTTCGDTVVSVQSGRVELRVGETVKQIAAGSQDSAGMAKPGLCKGRRP